MKLEYILLGLLARGPFSGYDIGKWMQREGRFYRSNTDQSQIYRMLRRMEDAGWIGHTVDPRAGRPDAKVYRMTEEGRAELVRWSREPYTPPSRFQDADFHVRFDIAGALDPVSLRALLVTELEARRRQVAESRDRDRTRSYPDPIAELDIDRADRLADASHRRGMLEIDTWIGWLERTLRDFDESGVTTPPGDRSPTEGP